MSISSPPFSSRILLMSFTSDAFLTKEAAIKSTSFLIPNKMSPISFSVRAGRFMLTLGTFTPLLFFKIPSLSAINFMSVSVLSTTLNSTRPSSIRTIPSMETSFGISL